MEIKRELENYLYYKASISRINNNILALQAKYPEVSGSNFMLNGDIRPQGYMTNNIENDITKKIDELNRLVGEKKILEANIQMLDDMMNTLKPFYKFIIEERYKKNKDIITIAKEVHRSEKSVSRSLNSAIKKLEKLF